MGILFWMEGHSSQNLLVKECMFRALVILMENLDFRKISISDITNKAGVSRMAYYRNYKSKEHIITDHLDIMFAMYLYEIHRKPNNNIYTSAYVFFAHARKEEKLIRNIIKSNIAFLIFDHFDKHLHIFLKKILGIDIKMGKYEKAYMTGGLYNITLQWIQAGMKESEEEMAQIISDHCTRFL